MKPRTVLTVLAFLLLPLLKMNAQQNRLPSVDVYTLDGDRVNASTIQNENNPMLLVFFKTNDNKCRENLYSLCEAHDEVLKQKGVKLVAVCMDCVGKIEHVKPFVLGHNIDVEIYVDKNGELKRSMGIPNAPFTILFDDKMKVYCQYNGYCTGAREMICEKVNQCLSEMKIPAMQIQ